MLDRILYEKLKDLVEGDGPVEQFARPFENFAPWKQEMGRLCRKFTVTPNFAPCVDFKSLRAGIVKHLQAQYDRIDNASRLVISGINDEKVKYGALDPSARDASEEYAATFERDKDPMTKAEFRLAKRKLDKMRMHEPREMKLQKLGRILKDQRFDLFKDAVRTLKTFLGVVWTNIGNSNLTHCPDAVETKVPTRIAYPRHANDRHGPEGFDIGSTMIDRASELLIQKRRDAKPDIELPENLASLRARGSSFQSLKHNFGLSSGDHAVYIAT
ncbi:hypothetical protein DSL72_005266 [Monilinia vaccinii-corymbosi]|uniref:Uncharacterized protein n=1 Tax=Monilinia vaccinii-corymbosi TaxID=61207 RepID=A0A8A3PF56_9HELO|nr:hypothetical protein DSL72_005266 [Monilinia vaccinii-corymbosi]